MGQTKTKVIDNALDPEKAKQLETAGVVDSPDQAKKVAKSKKAKKIKVRSKTYKNIISKIDKNLEYEFSQAVNILKDETKFKFDASLEAHINLNTSADNPEHQIRLLVSLPHTVAKKIKLLVFTSKNTEAIKKLGAVVGTEAILKELENGKVEFDKIIADSSWMPRLAKIAKVLGPKGLMPSPKSGTVSDDPLKAVTDFSGGQIEVKTEKNPIIHTIVGKMSMTSKQLSENFEKLISALNEAKPEGLKKEMIKSMFLSSTMSPSIKVSSKKVVEAEKS